MIITLCGSSRFEPWFHMWNQALGLSGHVPFGMCSYPSLHDGITDPNQALGSEEKEVLDQVHLRKIDASDAILVLNVFGYIGASTQREIDYTRKSSRKIYFLESWGKGCGVLYNHVKMILQAKISLGIDEKYVSPIDTTETKSVYDLLPSAGSYRNRITDFLKKKEQDALRYRFEMSRFYLPHRSGKCSKQRDIYGTLADCQSPHNHEGKCEF